MKGAIKVGKLDEYFAYSLRLLGREDEFVGCQHGVLSEYRMTISKIRKMLTKKSTIFKKRKKTGYGKLLTLHSKVFFLVDQTVAKCSAQTTFLKFHC